jgi:uncharacterized membrane protein YfcA
MNTADALHAIWAVYQWVVVPDGALWSLAAGMSTAMIAGTCVGKRLIETLPVARFRLLVAGMLAVTAFRRFG